MTGRSFDLNRLVNRPSAETAPMLHTDATLDSCARFHHLMDLAHALRSGRRRNSSRQNASGATHVPPMHRTRGSGGVSVAAC